MMNSDLPRRVTDARSNKNEQIVHAAEVLGRSTHRLAVFSAVYWHKKRVKTVTEIMERTGLPRVRVLQEGRKLVQQMIIGQTKAGGETAYEQDPFIQAHKRQILRLVAMPTELGAVPTKRNPASRNQDSGREQPRNAEAKYSTLCGTNMAEVNMWPRSSPTVQ